MSDTRSVSQLLGEAIALVEKAKTIYKTKEQIAELRKAQEKVKEAIRLEKEAHRLTGEAMQALKPFADGEAGEASDDARPR